MFINYEVLYNDICILDHKGEINDFVKQNDKVFMNSKLLSHLTMTLYFELFCCTFASVDFFYDAFSLLICVLVNEEYRISVFTNATL